MAGSSIFGVERHRWRPFAVLAGSFLAVIAVYWQTFAPMSRMWMLSTYQYGWFVFPISLAMLWHIRRRLASTYLSSSVAGLLALFGLVVVWVVASAANVQIVEFAAVIWMIPALVWAIGGTRLLSAGLFPLLFLIAAVPVGDSLVPTLMVSTADIATALLDAVGVPAFREGAFLTLPGGQFEVADVCSGLRYLLAGTIIAVLFAYWNYRSYRKRVIFVVGVAAGFIVANGVRAFIVMYVASATNMRIFAGQDHVIFGQFLFLALVILLMYIGGRYADPEESDDGHAFNDARATKLKPMIIAAAALFLLFGPVGEIFKDDVGAELGVVPFPAAGSSCPELSQWAPSWNPVVPAPDTQSMHSWRCGLIDVSLYQAAFLEQSQDRELISANNVLWPHEWRRYTILNERRQELDAQSVLVNEVFHSGGNASTLIWYWYDVAGVHTNSMLHVKVIEGASALRLRRPNAAVVVLIAEGNASRDELTAELEQSMRGLQ